jgi:hypothetical protein
MSKNVFVSIVALSLSMAVAAWAASPEQVGTYSGTIKSKVYAATGKTVVKSPMELSIAADDSTTLTINGGEVFSTLYLTDDAEAGLFFDSMTTVALNLSTLHFKKTSIKGSGTGIMQGPPAVNSEFKISLKKVAP